MHPADLIVLGLVALLAIILRKGLVSDGWGLDRGFAAIFMRAKHGETMSLQTALADEGGKRWACLLCRFLGLAVEKDHCRKVLIKDGPPTPVIASYRAGVLLLLTAALFLAVPWAIGRYG